MAVEAGPAGQVEQPVVQEPEHRVGDHVVVHAVQCRIEIEEVEVEPRHRCAAGGDRGAVVGVDGGRHPGLSLAVVGPGDEG